MPPNQYEEPIGPLPLTNNQLYYYDLYREINGVELQNRLIEQVSNWKLIGDSATIRNTLRVFMMSIDSEASSDELRRIMMDVMLMLADSTNSSINDLRIMNYARNINQEEVVDYSIVQESGWSKSPDSEKAFHITELPSQLVEKWTNIDGREYVFIGGTPDGQKSLISDGTNKGTFNYGPEAISLEHWVLDIFPWLLWGASPDDQTTPEYRLALMSTSELASRIRRLLEDPIGVLADTAESVNQEVGLGTGLPPQLQ